MMKSEWWRVNDVITAAPLYRRKLNAGVLVLRPHRAKQGERRTFSVGHRRHLVVRLSALISLKYPRGNNAAAQTDTSLDLMGSTFGHLSTRIRKTHNRMNLRLWGGTDVHYEYYLLSVQSGSFPLTCFNIWLQEETDLLHFKVKSLSSAPTCLISLLTAYLNTAVLWWPSLTLTSAHRIELQKEIIWFVFDSVWVGVDFHHWVEVLRTLQRGLGSILTLSRHRNQELSSTGLLRHLADTQTRTAGWGLPSHSACSFRLWDSAYDHLHGVTRAHLSPLDILCF